MRWLLVELAWGWLRWQPDRIEAEAGHRSEIAFLQRRDTEDANVLIAADLAE